MRSRPPSRPPAGNGPRRPSRPAANGDRPSRPAANGDRPSRPAANGARPSRPAGPGKRPSHPTRDSRVDDTAAPARSDRRPPRRKPEPELLTTSRAEAEALAARSKQSARPGRPRRADGAPSPGRLDRPDRPEHAADAGRPPRPVRPRRVDGPRQTRAPDASRDVAQRPGRPAAAGPARPSRASIAIEPQRIAKLLARAGIGSRRDIERMIAEGRIARHGEVLTTPATIIASLDGITVDGNPVAVPEIARLYRFHKPAGFLTTARDPAGRPTIMDILPPGLPRLVPVGRLDLNTEGLLLLTTDGGLKRALELPASGVPRTYRVRAYGDIHQRTIEGLIEGITIDGIHYGGIDAEIERRTGRNLWLTMTLREGKNREIRRVLEFLGLAVSRLIRVSYGPIELADLPPRGVDEVPDEMVALLRKALRAG